MTSKLKGQRGMSLVEATIILMVLAIVTAVLSPSINDYVNDARQVKTKEDVEAIGTAIARLMKDTGNPFLMEDGDVAIAGRFVTNNRVDLLVGSGNEPAVATGVDNSVTSNLQAVTTWLDDIAAAAPAAATGGVQSMFDQLVSNQATYVLPTATMDTIDPSAPSTLGKVGLGWRGSYLSGVIGPDPWGYRYACNAAFLGTANDAPVGANGGAGFGWSTDSFCLSAGQNNTIEVDIEGSLGGVNYGASTPVSNDDVIYVVSGFGK